MGGRRRGGVTVKKTRKAFTLIEILIVMAITVPVVTGLFTVFAHVQGIYGEVSEAVNNASDEYGFVYAAVNLASGAESVSIENGYIAFWSDDKAVLLDPEKYGCILLDLRIIDSKTAYIKTGGGAEVWLKCLPER